MPGAAHHQYSEDAPTAFARRRAAHEWVWTSSIGRGKSGLGAPRWKRISTQTLPASTTAEHPTEGGEAAPSTGGAAEVPLHVGGSARKGAAKERLMWKPRETPRPPPGGEGGSCPGGHALQQSVLSLPTVCGVCNEELGKGQSMWRCMPCDFDACTKCRLTTSGGGTTAAAAQAPNAAVTVAAASSASTASTALADGSASATDEATKPASEPAASASSAAFAEGSSSATDEAAKPSDAAASSSASSTALAEGSSSTDGASICGGGGASSSSSSSTGGVGECASPESVVQRGFDFCDGAGDDGAAVEAHGVVPVAAALAWETPGVGGHFMGLDPDFLGGPASAACAGWWDTTAQPHAGWSSGSMMVDMMLPHLAGDETLLGPDGEWYDVFYPPDGAPPSPLCMAPLVDDECCSDLSTSATSAPAARVEDFTCRDSFALGGSSQSIDDSPRDAVDGSVAVAPASPPAQQTAFGSEDAAVEADERRGATVAPFHFHQRDPAEVGIADMIAYMSQVAYERYPARAKLFETVQLAASDALAGHFARFALVGSTALGIDTPDSDLDAVAFTQPVEDDAGCVALPPSPVETLRCVAGRLCAADPTLQLQLVDCTRVPVLTVVTADGQHSLDLTVDEPLGERHVMWFQSQYSDPDPIPAPLYQVPVPPPDAWAHGLEAAVLRCVKWWLRRRGVPVAKEGGYPSVVWTLMVIHVLRCSIYVNSRPGADTRDRARDCLAAMAAFFDRFAEGGLAGTLCFASGKGAEFWPQQQLADAPLAPGDFSVLDPTTTCESSAAWGIEPLELAPRISPATQLLHAYELRRAQILSAAALMLGDGGGDWVPPRFETGGAALQELFAEVGESVNVLPSVKGPEPRGAVVFADGRLHFGLVEEIRPKPGWCASFLHRRDACSGFLLHLCDVDTVTGSVRKRVGLHATRWFHPCDFVCMALRKRCAHTTAGSKARAAFELEADSLERWVDMQTLLSGDFTCHVECDPHTGCAATAQIARAAHATRAGGRRGGKRRATACRQQARM